ncbi:hypothetical protein L596_002717 [Steinernema carpocapsae]|uniref:Uncharacterized protein n=1 Tax=Steinernema carpocapsae TaxID=34508 RepID=A0A4U8UQJ0_STECR|nr:hypothetical protein L596_002717 [Steinernema carpocapsae]
MDSFHSILVAFLSALFCVVHVCCQAEMNDYYSLDEISGVPPSYAPQLPRHRLLQMHVFARPDLMLRKRVSEQEINSLLRNTWLG